MSDSNEPVETTPEARVDLNKPKEAGAAPVEPRPSSEGEKTDAADISESPRENATESVASEPETSEIPEKEPPRQSSRERELEAGRTSVWNKTFDAFAKGGPIILLAALCAAVLPNYLSDRLFCPAEIKNVTAFLQCLTDQSWFTPIGWNPPLMELPAFIAAQGMGGASVAEWPAFYWLTGALGLIPGLADSGLLLSVAASISAGFALLAVWYLGIGARFGYQAAFAGGLVALCAPVIAPLPHFVGNAGLAVGFVIFAVAFFSRGLLVNRAYVSLPLAFICTSFAGLSGGPLLFLLPLLTAACFLIWKGDFKRAQAMDALVGFVCMLILIGLWLGKLQFVENGNAYLRELFAQSWSLRFPLPPYWELPLVIALMGVMPWIMTIFGVSWARVLKESPKTMGESRRDNGSALVWISLVLAACLPFFTGHFHLVATLLICIEAVLLGKAFVKLPPAGNRFFFFLASIFLVVVGVLMLAASFDATQDLLFHILPFAVPAAIGEAALKLDFLPIIGGIVLLGGVLCFGFVRWYKMNGGLIYALLFVLILTQPFLFGLAPEIGALPNTPLMTMSQIEKAYQARGATAPEAPTAPVVAEPAPPVAPVPASPVIPDVSGVIPPAETPAVQESAPTPPDTPSSEPSTPASPEANETGLPAPESAPAVGETPETPAETPAIQAPSAQTPNLPALPDTAVEQPPKKVIEEVIILEDGNKSAEELAKELAKDIAKDIETESAPNAAPAQ